MYKIIILIILLLLVYLYYIKIRENFYFNKKISVILLNYNRPHNLEKSLPILNNYNIIDEIIVAHGHSKYYKNFNFSKVKNIKDFKNNDIYGCGRRWFLINSIKNDIVLLLDDDIIPSEKLINDSYNKLLNNLNKNTIYGCMKRKCSKDGYFIGVNKKKYDSILTPFLLTQKHILKTYMDKGFKNYKDWIIKYKGNCEDLGINLFIRKYYNERPIFVEGNYKSLDTKNGYSSKSNHYKIRNEFCKKYA